MTPFPSPPNWKQKIEKNSQNFLCLSFVFGTNFLIQKKTRIFTQNIKISSKKFNTKYFFLNLNSKSLAISPWSFDLCAKNLCFILFFIQQQKKTLLDQLKFSFSLVFFYIPDDLQKKEEQK